MRATLAFNGLIKEFTNGGKSDSEQFFGHRLSSTGMVIESAFGRLKARFGCLRRAYKAGYKTGYKTL